MSDIWNERLQALIGLVYDAALDPARWSEVMTQLAQVYEGRAVLFAEDARTPGASVFGAGLFEDDYLQSYQEHYTATNIWTPLIEPLATGRTFDARIVPADEFERSEWYNDWLKPQDLYHSIGFVVANEDGLQTRMSVLRPRRAGSYGEDEMRAWRMLGGHVQRAFQIHRQLFVAKLERDTAREGLDRLGIAAYVVDADGRILSMNRAGSSLLEEGDALSAPSGRIVARRPGATSRLQHLVASAARTAAASGTHSGGAVELPRKKRRPLSAIVSPMCGNGLGLGISVPAALLFVRDPDRDAIGSPEQIKALFGLTDAEARLAVMADVPSAETAVIRWKRN